MSFRAGKTTCPKCGSEWDDWVIFCAECGARIGKPGAVPLPSTLGEPPAAEPPAPTVGKREPVGVSLVPRMAVPVRPTVGRTPGPAPVIELEVSEVSDWDDPMLDDQVSSTHSSISSPVQQKLEPVVAPPAPLLVKPQTAQPLQRPVFSYSSLTRPESAPASVPASRPEAPVSAAKPVAAPELPVSSLQGEGAPPHAQPDQPSRGQAVNALGEAEEIRALFDEVDAGFKMILEPGSAGGQAEASNPLSEKELEAQAAKAAEADRKAVRELFEQIVVEHARSLREFMIEMSMGDASKTWLQICTPATVSLRKAAEKMEILPELCTALDSFVAALELSTLGTTRTVPPEARELLVSAYEDLVKAMPQAFTLGAEKNRREPIIVHSLLLQVPDVGKVTLDKLYQAGIARLEMFYAANPAEVAVAAGLALDTAERICARFKAYRTESESTDADAERATERKKLEALLEAMKQSNVAFERANSSWSSQAMAEKKRIRSERTSLFLEVKVVLARMGEVDLVEALEKVPFELKTRDLETYIEQSRRKAIESS